MPKLMLKPQKAQLTAWSVALAVLAAAMFLFPALCLPLALLTPLFACLLLKSRMQWVAWASVAAPMAAALLDGQDGLFSASLLLPCGLALAVTCLPSEKRLGVKGLLWYLGASTAALTMIVFCASYALGAPLSDALTQTLMRRVQNAENQGQLLYRFAQAGLAGVPKEYRQAGPLAYALDPVLIRQLLLSLEETVRRLLESLLPQAFVQAALLGGLFTALRVRRAEGVFVVVEAAAPGNDGQRTARVAIQPGFRFLTIPPGLRRALVGMGMASLLLMYAEQSLLATLGLLFYTAFSAAFALQGAAVLVCTLAAKKPERLTAAGFLAAALYVLFPLALVLLGLSDSFVHYRAKLLRSDQKKS